MDINATSVIAQYLTQGQNQAGQAALKSTLKTEEQTAKILAQAVDAAKSIDGQRGNQLDILV